MLNLHWYLHSGSLPKAVSQILGLANVQTLASTCLNNLRVWQVAGKNGRMFFGKCEYLQELGKSV